MTPTHVLAWRIPWTEEADGLHTVHGVTECQTPLKQLSVQVIYD